MQKSFTKIPHDITSQPWATSPTVMHLYTWLSLTAGNDGVVRASLDDLARLTSLSKKQIRSALEKLERAHYTAHSRAHCGAHCKTEITICYLSSYSDVKNAEGTLEGTLKGTFSRANKNDNILSSLNVEEKIISPNVEIITHTLSACEKFQAWLKRECPYIASHYKLPTKNEFAKLKTQYGSKAIAEECTNIENRLDLRKKYSNLYRTLLNWLKRRNNETIQIHWQYHQKDNDFPDNQQFLRQTYELIEEARQGNRDHTQILPF